MLSSALTSKPFTEQGICGMPLDLLAQASLLDSFNTGVLPWSGQACETETA